MPLSKEERKLFKQAAKETKSRINEPKGEKLADEFFKSDEAMLRHFERLAGEHKRRAYARTFAISAIENTERLNAIHNTLYEAYKKGLSFDDVKKDLTKLSENKDPHRLKVVFDTNLRNAYNAARFEEQLKGSKPYFRYVSAGDTRVRKEHAAWHGVVLPKDDPFWASNYPPNGFGCRCKVQAISASEAKRFGVSKRPNLPPPSAGSKFKANPLQPDGGLLKTLGDKIKKMPSGNTLEKLARKRSAQALSNAAAAGKEFNEAYYKIKPIFNEALEELATTRGGVSAVADIAKKQTANLSATVRAAKQAVIGQFNGSDLIIDGYNIRTHLKHRINAADYALVPNLLKHAGEPKIQAKYDKNGKHTKDELTYKINHGRGWTLTLTQMVGDNKRLFITSLYDDLSDI